MLDFIIRSAFIITISLAILVYPFGYIDYCLANLFTAGIAVVAYLINRRGHFRFAFWFGCLTISVQMVIYTYVFGYINAHLYLLSGMVLLNFFIGKSKFASRVVWIIAGALFILSHYFLLESGRIPELDDLESVLFYPNLVLSLVLLYLSTSIYSKKQENQRKALNDSLEIKDKFLSLLSHDLRTPFHTLSGIVDLMDSKEMSKEEFDSSLKEIKANINSSYNMLDNVLLWVNSQHDEIKVKQELVSLNEVIQENIGLFKAISNTKGIVVKVFSSVAVVKSDKEMLNTIIRNLLSNAIKFSPIEKGIVEIEVIEQEKYYQLQIRDNGPGIPKEKIVGLFNNGDSELGSDNEKGFGIGLKLVSLFSKKINIEVSVDSEEEKGTQFILNIPR